MDMFSLTEADTQVGLLLAFQPVYASNLDVAAFTLLSGQQHADARLAETISAINQVIIQSYASLYQQGSLQTLPCFLKVSSDTLMDPDFPVLPQKQYILEVDLSAGWPDELEGHLHALARAGHRLALSGMDISDPRLRALLKRVHILRVDINSLGRDGLQAAHTLSRPWGLETMVEGLRDLETFRFAVELGYHYFSGETFGKPQLVRGRIPKPDKVLLLSLLSALEDPALALERLEELIIRDANLTYRFFKLANAASYGLNREIDILSQALSMLGTRQIQRWVSLFLLEGHSDKPHELCRRMLIRARMCEVLAASAHFPQQISYFIVGLLSLLDQLTDITMPDLMAEVALSRDIKAALLERSGTMGAVLTDVEHYERGEFDQLQVMSEAQFYEIAYRHSTAWANQLLSTENQGAR